MQNMYNMSITEICTKKIILKPSWRKAHIPCSSGAGGVGSIPANPDAQNVPSFRRWRFEMKLSPPFFFCKICRICKIICRI